MMNFNTISEYKILNIAWGQLINFWWMEEIKIEEAKSKGHTNTIAEYEAIEYKKQADEIHERLLELEGKK